jgi:hypothetical protein
MGITDIACIVKKENAVVSNYTNLSFMMMVNYLSLPAFGCQGRGLPFPQN